MRKSQLKDYDINLITRCCGTSERRKSEWGRENGVNFEKGSWLPFSIIISCNEHHRARRFRRAFNALRETIPVGLFEPRGRLPSEFPPFPLCVHIEEGRGSVMGHNKLSLTEETRVNLDDTQVYRYCRRRLIGFSCNEINLCSVSKTEPRSQQTFY